jgi:hypothetical protein
MNMRTTTRTRATLFLLNIALIFGPLFTIAQPARPALAQSDISGIICIAAGCIVQNVQLGAIPLIAVLESAVITEMLETHQLPASDKDRLLTWERNALRARLFDKVLAIIKEAPSSRTADEQAIVDFFAEKVKQKRLAAATAAKAEYGDWNLDPCGYVPPAGFEYDPGSTICSGLGGVFGRPNPPSLEEFQAYGATIAYDELRDNQDFDSVSAGTARGIALLGGLVGAGIIGAAVGAIAGGALAATSLFAAVFPFATLQAATVGAVAASSLAAGVGIVIAAIIIGVIQGVNVFTAAEIPGKLDDAIVAAQATPDLAQVVDTDEGLREVYTAFILTTLPDYPPAGPVPATQPSDLTFDLTDSTGRPSTSADLPYQAPDTSLHVARLSEGWFVDTHSSTRRLALGIDYLDWQGQKWTAWRVGNQFLLTTTEHTNAIGFLSDKIDFKGTDGQNWSARISPDTTPPSISVSVTTSQGSPYTADTWTSDTVNVDFTCSDNRAVATCPADQSFNSDGVFTVNGVAVDTAGNRAAISFGPIKIDRTPPTFTISAKKADGTDYTFNTWSNQTVTLRFTCTDAGSGVASCPGDAVFQDDTNLGLIFRASDNLGNSVGAGYWVQVDKTPPSVSCGSPDGAWRASDASIACRASDATSGLANAADASFTLTTNVAGGTANENAATGSRSISDQAGNTVIAGPIAGNKVDKQPPTIAASAQQADNAPYTAGTWTKQAVTVHFSCADAGSGLASCPADQIFSADGVSTASGEASDVAGNTASASLGPIQIDSTKPTISAAATSAPNAAGWYNSSVTVQFSCADALSGIPAGACPADQVLSSEGNAVASTTQTVGDLAGNLSAPSNVVTAKIDVTAPATIGSVSTGSGRATVTLTASDGLSGVAGTSYRIDGGALQSYSGPFTIATAGEHTISFFSVDVAGNSEAPKTLVVNVPAFPTTGVLDSFTRANGSVGSNWQGLTRTGFYKIASNKLDVQAGGPIAWKSAFGSSQEAFVTLSTLDTRSPSQGVLLKVQDSSKAEAGAILVVYDARAKVVRVSAIRLGAREWTVYLNQAATFANGDVLGARAKADGTVEVYQNGVQIARATLNAEDGAFFNSKGGKIGIWTAVAPRAVLDDFGGGTVAP